HEAGQHPAEHEKSAQVVPVEQELADEPADQAADRADGDADNDARDDAPELPQREIPDRFERAEGEGDEQAKEHALHAGAADGIAVRNDASDGPPRDRGPAAAQRTRVDEYAERHRKPQFIDQALRISKSI